MKKLLAFILAFTVVFSMTAMFTPVSASGKDKSGISYINYLDFSSKNNKWDERDPADPTKYLHTSFKGTDYVDQNGNLGGDYYPFALIDTVSGLKYDATKQDNEVIRLEAEDANSPYIAFQVAQMNTYALGREDDGKAEFVKIRFKNNSPSTKITFMGTNNSYSNGALDRRVTATIEVKPNSAEWQTVIISMVDGTMNSANNTLTGQNTWNSYLKKFAIYPFGYNKDNEAIVNENYYMEIDYVVIGSESYCKEYKSELEKKEEAATSFKLSESILDKNGKVDGSIIDTKYNLGETINLDGIKADIEYGSSDYTDTTVNGDSLSAIYNFDRPKDLDKSQHSWPATVTLMYGSLTATYEVTVYDIYGISFEYDKSVGELDDRIYDKIEILQNGFTPEGIKTLEDIKVLIKHYQIDPATGSRWETRKSLSEVDLEGTDFSGGVELSKDGYYEYLVTVKYYARDLSLPVKIKDIVGLEVIPVQDKIGAIYYGTELNKNDRKATDENGKEYTVGNQFFDVNCVYTDGTKKAIDKTGLLNNLSVTGNTKTNGGNINATVTLSNTAYGINFTKDVEVTVQTPTKIHATVKGKYDIDDTIGRERFTVKYEYADKTVVTVDSEDPSLVFKYDTSNSGTGLEGVLEINGKKEATFKFDVKEAEFSDKAVQKPLGEKVKLLKPRIPTGLIVAGVFAAVVLVFVGGWALLKYVFKVDFKRKKRVSLDDIF